MWTLKASASSPLCGSLGARNRRRPTIGPANRWSSSSAKKPSWATKALVEGRYRGMLYRDSLSAPVSIGQQLKGFVRAVRPDGKIDLSLDQAGYQRVAPLAARIVERLQRHGGRLELDDDSPPEAIRQAFGASKKAFKQALGSLYKARRIRFCNPGLELLDNRHWSPGSPLYRKTNPQKTVKKVCSDPAW